MKVEKPTALLAFAALLTLAGISFAALNCIGGIGTGCSLSDSPPACCSEGLVCWMPLGQCCIPSGSSTPCSADNECCLGKCKGTSCVSQLGCGETCTDSLDCGSACPICADNGSIEVCSSCIVNNSPTSCSSNSQCCSGRCNPSNSTCSSCFGINVSCSRGSDCCSGRCEFPLANESGRCAPAVNLSFSGGPCTNSSGCSPSPPSFYTLYCDLLNPNPFASHAGACRSCVPDGMACNGSISPCTPSYSCRSAPSLGTGNFSLNSTGGSPTQLLANWVKNGTGKISVDTYGERSGVACLLLESGGAESYAYNSKLSLKNNSKYLLEFYYNDSAPRYAVYDVNNDAYLSASGEWVFSPRNGTFESPIVISAGASVSTYTRFARNFSTLMQNVAHVQVRLYTPVSGSSYVDDLSIVQVHDLSMLAWIRQPLKDAGSVFDKLGTEGASYQGINWKTNASGFLIMGLNSANPASGNISPAANISDGNWHLAALTVDRMGNYTAYLDGVQLSTGAFNLGRLNSSVPFQIGNGDAGYFKGLLDDVRFYQRKLSSSEIQSHYIGNYQQKCSYSITTSYPSLPSSSPAHFNAHLRLRQAPPETLLYLAFDQNISSDATGMITDYSPKLTPGTKSGANWTPSGRSGGAYNFSAASDNRISVNVPVLSGDADFTLSAWINPSSITGTRYIMGNLDSANQNGAGLVITNASQIAFYAAGKTILSNRTVSTSQWWHVASSRFRGNGTIYINGISAGDGDLSGTVSRLAGFAVGALPVNAGQGFQGLIDEPRVVGKALSAQEISALHKEGYLLANSTLPPSKMRG